MAISGDQNIDFTIIPCTTPTKPEPPLHLIFLSTYNSLYLVLLFYLFLQRNKEGKIGQRHALIVWIFVVCGFNRVQIGKKKSRNIFYIIGRRRKKYIYRGFISCVGLHSESGFVGCIGNLRDTDFICAFHGIFVCLGDKCITMLYNQSAFTKNKIK